MRKSLKKYSKKNRYSNNRNLSKKGGFVTVKRDNGKINNNNINNNINNNNINNNKTVDEYKDSKYSGAKKTILNYINNYLFEDTLKKVPTIGQHRKRYYHENTFNRDMMNLCVLMSIKKDTIKIEKEDMKSRLKAYIAIRFYENFLKLYEYQHLHSLLRSPSWLLKNALSLGTVSFFKSSDIKIFLEREKFYYLIYEIFLKLYDENSEKLDVEFKQIIDDQNKRNLYLKIYNLIHIFFKTFVDTEELYDKTLSSEGRANNSNGGQSLYPGNNERGSLVNILMLFDFVYLSKYRKKNKSGGGIFRDYYRKTELNLRKRRGTPYSIRYRNRKLSGYASRDSKTLKEFNLDPNTFPIAKRDITDDAISLEAMYKHEKANTNISGTCNVYINNRDGYKIKLKSNFMRKYYTEILNDKISNLLISNTEESRKILTLFLVAFFEYNHNNEYIEYLALAQKEINHGSFFTYDRVNELEKERGRLSLVEQLKKSRGGSIKKNRKSQKNRKSKK
jgi:hypothetical protein